VTGGQRDVQLSYGLKDTVGWVVASFVIGECSARVTGSWIGAPLWSVAFAVVCLLRGAERATADFPEEPGDFEVRLTRQESGRLRVVVVWIDDDAVRNHTAEVLLDAECGFEEFVNAVADGTEAVLDQWGEDGYRTRWGHDDFPTAELALLREAIGGDYVLASFPDDDPADPPDFAPLGEG